MILAVTGTGVGTVKNNVSAKADENQTPVNASADDKDVGPDVKLVILLLLILLIVFIRVVLLLMEVFGPLLNLKMVLLFL